MEPRSQVDKNFILDEAMQTIARLQQELIIKNAFIRQLQAELTSIIQPKADLKKEETV